MDGNAGQEENANSLYRASSINGRGDMDNNYDNNNKVLNDDLDDDNNEVAIDNNKEKVNDEDAAVFTRKLAKMEGIFAGNSCGAAVKGVLQLKKHLFKLPV